MLAAIGVTSIEDLFDEIPAEIRAKTLDLPTGLKEQAINRVMSNYAKQDEVELSFLGAGAYEHYIPAAVWALASRGELMTAYTPYQAEASQGTLQIIYEYQSMMSELLAMDVVNASMYDGASAVAEAILMAIRCNKKVKEKHVLVPETLHPSYRKVIESIVSHQNIRCSLIPFCAESGRFDQTTLSAYEDQNVAAVVIPQPNFFGVIDDVDGLTNWAHAHHAMAIAVVNPIAMALLKPPGQWGHDGADIVCGEGQPLGVPLSSGGPYFGFMGCRMSQVRQLPGRLVGKTVDLDGKEGFTLTLQAREQHIRRGKAKSNICTNQGLLVTAATIFMSLLGGEGLKRIAKISHQQTQALVNALAKKGIKRRFTAPFFHEVVLDGSDHLSSQLQAMQSQKIEAGFDLSADYPSLKNQILTCVTETKTTDDIQRLVDVWTNMEQER